MNIDIESLGFTKEELQNRVLDRLCERIEGDNIVDGETFATKLNAIVKKQIDATVTALAEKHILPNVAAYIETLCLQETTKWGEKRGEKLTFIEYLTSRAEAYLREEVNHAGKAKNETDGYSWNKSQTRIAHMVNQHLHYSIETAMKDAVSAANSAIVEGIEKTVKIKLEEISKTLKVTVKTS